MLKHLRSAYHTCLDGLGARGFVQAPHPGAFHMNHVQASNEEGNSYDSVGMLRHVAVDLWEPDGVNQNNEAGTKELNYRFIGRVQKKS